MKLVNFFVFIGCFWTALSAAALELEYLDKVELKFKQDFKKTKVGGLSALIYEQDKQNLWLLSDDRGTVNEPRLYKAKLYLAPKFEIHLDDVIFIKRPAKKDFQEVLDLESIALLPWGGFLIGSEGDTNRKPRQVPQLFEVGPQGTLTKTHPVPEMFLPELAGQQTQGIRNNLGFESMTQIPGKNEWVVAAEAPLFQDERPYVRWIRYVMPETWVLKPAEQWVYPVTQEPSTGISFQNGVSEILALDSHRFLVLERRLEVTGGLRFRVLIYLADIKGLPDVSKAAKLEGKSPVAQKTLLLDFESLTSTLGKVQNYEGMAWGPVLPNGKRTLLLVSDDNFMRDLRTQILLFSVKE